MHPASHPAGSSITTPSPPTGPVGLAVATGPPIPVAKVVCICFVVAHAHHWSFQKSMVLGVSSWQKGEWLLRTQEQQHLVDAETRLTTSFSPLWSLDPQS